MVVCIIALVVLAFMGIFSAKYRVYAKEAASCVGRMVTFRPCKMNFDDKVRAKLTSKISSKSTRAAGFVYKHFGTMSWIFVIVFFVSIVFTGLGIYNYVTYGTCDPSSDDGMCVYNEIGDLVSGEECDCGSPDCTAHITGECTGEECGCEDLDCDTAIE
ncbi:hypothetical protein ACFLQN_04730 [Candidatus Aenigmatarchaeota archaeon]